MRQRIAPPAIASAASEIWTRDLHFTKVLLYHWAKAAQAKAGKSTSWATLAKAGERIWTAGLFLGKEAFYHWTTPAYNPILAQIGSILKKKYPCFGDIKNFWRARPDSNRRSSPWQGDVLGLYTTSPKSTFILPYFWPTLNLCPSSYAATARNVYKNFATFRFHPETSRFF